MRQGDHERWHLRAKGQMLGGSELASPIIGE
jgi:hypothetical protein